MRSIRASLLVLGFYGVIVGAASLAVTGESFQPVKVTVDLSHADQRPLLSGPWEIRPDARFPGVMAARDRGQPVHLTVTLPVSQTYQGRWKLKCERPGQAIEVQVNGTAITTVRPSKIGKAQKVAMVIPARLVVPGANRITFVNHGTPGGTEYELIRLQNYQAALVKQHLYLLPRAAGDTSSPHASLPIALAAIAIVGAVAASAAWVLRYWTGRSWSEALAAERLACAPLLVMAVLVVVPWVAPYRLICTPLFFWQLAGILLVAGHAVLVVHWALQRLMRLLASLDPRAGAELVTGAFGQSRQLSQTGAAVVTSALGRGWWWCTRSVRWLIAALGLGLRLAVLGLRESWRWFRRQQYPQGYAKIFCYTAAVALVSHWVFHWERFAEVSGYVAGGALVIAVVWESLVSLDEEEG